MTEFSFQKASKTKVKARIAIDGPSGSGKTYTSLVAATSLADGGKIAVIDTERGSARLYSDTFDFDVLELENFHPNNYIKAIETAEKGGYSALVIDSLSHAWEGEGGALDLADEATKRQKTPNSYTAWKEVTPIHRKMVDAILNSKMHVIATMRSKMDYVQEKDGNGRTSIRKVGLAPIQRAGMEYEFTLVGDMDLDHTIVISKSRCPLLSDMVEKKPGLPFFDIFRNWLNEGAEAAPKPAPKSAPLYTTELVADRPATPVMMGHPVEIETELTIEEANAETNSRGATYGSLDSNILKNMSGSIYKALKEPMVSAEETASYNRKLNAIDVILQSREG